MASAGAPLAAALPFLDVVQHRLDLVAAGRHCPGQGIITSWQGASGSSPAAHIMR